MSRRGLFFGSADSIDKTRASSRHSDSRSVNILLVEDHEDSRAVLSNLLAHCGYTVAAASNVEEALSLLGDRHFDVLVSDIGLPDGSGLDLVVEARKRQPWKKTVALTALGQNAERELGLRAGFDEPDQTVRFSSAALAARGNANRPRGPPERIRMSLGPPNVSRRRDRPGLWGLLFSPCAGDRRRGNGPLSLPFLNSPSLFLTAS